MTKTFNCFTCTFCLGKYFDSPYHFRTIIHFFFAEAPPNFLPRLFDVRSVICFHFPFCAVPWNNLYAIFRAASVTSQTNSQPDRVKQDRFHRIVFTSVFAGPRVAVPSRQSLCVGLIARSAFTSVCDSSHISLHHTKLEGRIQPMFEKSRWWWPCFCLFQIAVAATELMTGWCRIWCGKRLWDRATFSPCQQHSLSLFALIYWFSTWRWFFTWLYLESLDLVLHSSIMSLSSCCSSFDAVEFLISSGKNSTTFQGLNLIT